MDVTLDRFEPPLTVHYEVIGEGRPVLMLHGSGMSHRQMIHDMEPAFAARSDWQRIYIDLPGHGATPGPDWIRRQDDMLAVLLAFIDAVIGDQRFVLIGASYGGYLARAIVHRLGAQIDGVFLITPGITLDPAHHDLPSPVTLVREFGIDAGLTPAQAGFVGMNPVQSRALVAWMRANPHQDSAFLRQLLASGDFSFDPDALPKVFTRPALFLLGRQDAVVGYRLTWTMLERYPRATFAVLDRAGHIPVADQPVLFYALAAEWLDRVEEASSLTD